MEKEIKKMDTSTKEEGAIKQNLHSLLELGQELSEGILTLRDNYCEKILKERVIHRLVNFKNVSPKIDVTDYFNIVVSHLHLGVSSTGIDIDCIKAYRRNGVIEISSKYNSVKKLLCAMTELSQLILDIVNKISSYYECPIEHTLHDGEYLILSSFISEYEMCNIVNIAVNQSAKIWIDRFTDAINHLFILNARIEKENNNTIINM